MVSGGESSQDLLKEACEDLADLIGQLDIAEIRNGQAAAGLHTVDHLLADMDRQPAERHSSGLESRPPGNIVTLDVKMNAYAVVRDVEMDLRYRVAGHAGTPRGGSDGNTRTALQNIPKLGSGCDEHTRQRATSRIRAASRQIEMLASIDTAPRWLKIRNPDGGYVLCPYCRTPSLRVAMLSGIVACLFPRCVDSMGHSPTGRMGINRADATAVVEFRDGFVMYDATTLVD